MNVGSNGKYPRGALSNFTGNRFTVDGVECYSMEGFLQGLKFKGVEMQAQICKLVGFGAKKAGRGKNWQQKQILWWKGEAIPRKSERYQSLLDEAYRAMFEQCPDFRKALLASGDSPLTHTIGRRNPAETVLTRAEFCGRLTNLRAELRSPFNQFGG